MKGQAVEKRYGSDLTSIECQDVKLQLPDKRERCKRSSCETNI